MSCYICHINCGVCSTYGGEMLLCGICSKEKNALLSQKNALNEYCLKLDDVKTLKYYGKKLSAHISFMYFRGDLERLVINKYGNLEEHATIKNIRDDRRLERLNKREAESRSQRTPNLVTSG